MTAVPSPTTGPVVFVNYPNDGSASLPLSRGPVSRSAGTSLFPLFLRFLLRSPKNGSIPVCSSLIIKGLDLCFGERGRDSEMGSGEKKGTVRRKEAGGHGAALFSQADSNHRL